MVAIETTGQTDSDQSLLLDLDWLQDGSVRISKKRIHFIWSEPFLGPVLINHRWFTETFLPSVRRVSVEWFRCRYYELEHPAHELDDCEDWDSNPQLLLTSWSS